jgi:hypothetical protein
MLIAKRFMPKLGDWELNHFLYDVFAEGGAQTLPEAFGALPPFARSVVSLIDGRTRACAYKSAGPDKLWAQQRKFLPRETGYNACAINSQIR